MRAMRAPERDRGGVDALGLVLIAPAVIGLAVLVVFLGRQVDARAQVQSAAEFAAQAAARERAPAAAERAGRAVVEAMLTDADTCSDPRAAFDLSQFRAGGSVAVSVSCSVSSRGIELINPPARTFTVTASAGIDAFRATEASP